MSNFYAVERVEIVKQRVVEIVRATNEAEARDDGELVGILDTERLDVIESSSTARVADPHEVEDAEPTVCSRQILADLIGGLRLIACAPATSEETASALAQLADAADALAA